MKKLVLLSTFFLCFFDSVQAQKNHLSLIHDFDGNDFDYSVIGMVGVNDSLYVISFTPNRHGMFFRIDENGDGYKVIYEFDNVNYEPSSIVGNDKAIYITTRLTGGALFKYSLEDYSFKLIREFKFTAVGEVSVKYLTDSVLWYTSASSNDDEGSVFSTNLDGTGIKKLYAATNAEEASRPSNFFFHGNKVYIAFWGGGNLDRTSTYCGSIIRINKDGSGYEKIIAGSDERGTAPQSLVVYNNKLIGLFAYSGADWSGRVFRSNLDGSDYEPLGSVGSRSLTRFLSTHSLIYGVSTFAIYGINPHNGKIQMYDDFLSNPDFGVDVVSDPVYLNGDVFITAQQGGPNGGGTILKWLNARPELRVPESNHGRITTITEIDLNALFVDPNEDPLTLSYEYNHELLTISESNGILTLTPLTSDTVEIKITATDGWAGYAGTRIKLNPFEIIPFIPAEAIIENSSENPEESNGESPEESNGESPEETNGESPDESNGESPDESNGENPDVNNGEDPDVNNGENPDLNNGENTDDIVTSTDEEISKYNMFVFPNPTNSVLKLSITNIELLQILGVDGTVHQSFRNPEQEVNMSSFPNGFYIVRVKANGKYYWQKIIKN